MTKSKLKPRELSALQDDYLAKREEILHGKVNSLAATLFEKVYNEYLIQLELNDGKIIHNDRNISLVKGLDEIYNQFRNNENIKVIKGFTEDLQAIVPLNETYFTTLTQKNLDLQSEFVTKSIDSKLGLNEDGTIKKNGFTDKFIRDKSTIKAIKKTVTKSITNGEGFQELRVKLKETIQGKPNEPLSGKLQQYYRNFAYDTYIKVDRLSADMFAKDLSLRYFYYTGGIINTTRPMCEECNGMIIDSQEWKNLTYKSLLPEFRPGIPDGSNEDWNPLDDLGGYGCRHRKRYVLDSIALQNQSNIFKTSILTNG